MIREHLFLAVSLVVSFFWAVVLLVHAAQFFGFPLLS